jgi:hypothetical protein
MGLTDLIFAEREFSSLIPPAVDIPSGEIPAPPDAPVVRVKIEEDKAKCVNESYVKSPRRMDIFAAVGPMDDQSHQSFCDLNPEPNVLGTALFVPAPMTELERNDVNLTHATLQLISDRIVEKVCEIDEDQRMFQLQGITFAGIDNNISPEALAQILPLPAPQRIAPLDTSLIWSFWKNEEQEDDDDDIC